MEAGKQKAVMHKTSCIHERTTRVTAFVREEP